MSDWIYYTQYENSGWFLYELSTHWANQKQHFRSDLRIDPHAAIDPILQRLKTALKMAEGREQLTRKEMNELKWAIYSVNCYPENSTAVDEALDIVRGNHEDKIKISGSVKQEIEKWKEWDGIHKISYQD